MAMPTGAGCQEKRWNDEESPNPAGQAQSSGSGCAESMSMMALCTFRIQAFVCPRPPRSMLVREASDARADHRAR